MGVFLFIFGGVIKGSFNKLLNETYFYSEHVGHPDFALNKQKQRKDLWKSCRCNYCIRLLALVVALYLFISFVLGIGGLVG